MIEKASMIPKDEAKEPIPLK